jgi:hypothetical protein
MKPFRKQIGIQLLVGLQQAGKKKSPITDCPPAHAEGQLKTQTQNKTRQNYNALKDSAIKFALFPVLSDT